MHCTSNQLVKIPVWAPTAAYYQGDMAESHGIIIVGAGICGLATALALHRKGIASLVLEKSETLRADGGYIGIHVNGWRVLEQLGIAAELRETAGLVTAFHNVWQQENKSILVPVRKELRWLNRKDLIEAMAKNLPAGAIRFGCHIAAIHPTDPGNNHGAVLTTLDGSIIMAKVLIGCDGSNSVVAKYLGLSEPKPTPRALLRGFARYPHGHQFGDHFLRLRGKGFFVGRSPVTDNVVSFFVACYRSSPSAEITKDVRAMKRYVLQTLRDHQCPAEIVEMVESSDPESLIVLANVWYRPPWQVAFAGFQKGAVTVAGDAMHAMGPFIGQGGSAALEDALVLARSLSRAAGGGDGGGVPCEETASAAIGAYVRERRLRVARLSLEAFTVGALMRAKGLVAKLACSAILALLGNEALGHTNYDCGRL